MAEIKSILEIIGGLIVVGGLLYQLISSWVINNRRYDEVTKQFADFQEHIKRCTSKFEAMNERFSEMEVTNAQYKEKVTQLEIFVSNLRAIRYEPAHPFFLKKPEAE